MITLADATLGVCHRFDWYNFLFIFLFSFSSIDCSEQLRSSILEGFHIPETFSHSRRVIASVFRTLDTLLRRISEREASFHRTETARGVGGARGSVRPRRRWKPSPQSSRWRQLRRLISHSVILSLFTLHLYFFRLIIFSFRYFSRFLFLSIVLGSHPSALRTHRIQHSHLSEDNNWHTFRKTFLYD